MPGLRRGAGSKPECSTLYSCLPSQEFHCERTQDDETCDCAGGSQRSAYQSEVGMNQLYSTILLKAIGSREWHIHPEK